MPPFNNQNKRKEQEIRLWRIRNTYFDILDFGNSYRPS